MTFNVVIRKGVFFFVCILVFSKGVLLPMVRQPITKLQLTKNFCYHQGPNRSFYGCGLISPAFECM